MGHPPDWLGSSRFASTPSRAVYNDLAFAPIGDEWLEKTPVQERDPPLSEGGTGREFPHRHARTGLSPHILPIFEL